jgi:hypothetical protein
MSRWLVYSGDEETRQCDEVNRSSVWGVMNDGITGRCVLVAIVELYFCFE